MAAEHKHDPQGVGGHDCNFVESPPDDLVCKICQCPPLMPSKLISAVDRISVRIVLTNT